MNVGNDSVGDGTLRHLKTSVGKPVAGEQFFNRTHELADFIEILDDGDNISLIAPRRVGKQALGGIRAEKACGQQAQHRLVQADTLAWLRAERGMFDLVFVDPPTFSNSKRADDFDVQRDHVALVDACMARVAPGGLLVFSNNFRRFKLAPEVQERFLVVDVTARTIPPDFARDQRIHHCFEIRRR